MFRRRRKGTHRLEVDDEIVRMVLADGSRQEVAWRELAEVRVVTTSKGPFEEDVFFVLLAGSGRTGCVIPLALSDDMLMRRLQALPGFDNVVATQAMTSAEEATFVCWRREAD